MQPLLKTILFWRTWRPAAQRRFVRLALSAVVLCCGVGLAAYGMRDRFLYFYTPSEYAALPQKPAARFRLGGLVEKGSLQKNGDVFVFTVGDASSHKITVEYRGLPPDLFREGQGVIADGTMQNDRFMADYLLAKHDEKYMPPQVASSLKAQGHIEK